MTNTAKKMNEMTVEELRARLPEIKAARKAQKEKFSVELQALWDAHREAVNALRAERDEIYAEIALRRKENRKAKIETNESTPTVVDSTVEDADIAAIEELCAEAIA